MKKRVIVYGLGKDFEYNREFIENEYCVVGYSDSKEKDIEKYILPLKIRDQVYDSIIITSTDYEDEIKAYLFQLGIERDKIVTLESLRWYTKSSDEIRFEMVVDFLGKIPAGATLLDAGAGEEKYKPFCGHLKYISQDFGEYDEASKKEGLHPDSWNSKKCDIISDIIDIPIDDGSIDYILCSEVFEHIVSPELAVKEFSRILKKGGGCLITAPLASATHFAPYHFVSGYDRYWYEDVLPRYGFRITDIRAYGNYFDYIAQEIKRIFHIKENYCKGGGIPIAAEAKEMIVKLKELSQVDSGSSEILNFGFFVTALKV